MHREYTGAQRDVVRPMVSYRSADKNEIAASLVTFVGTGMRGETDLQNVG